MNKVIRNITLIGSGNVAGYFGGRFLKNGFTISEVISRNPEKGKALAELLNTTYTEAYEAKYQSDLVLIAVNDDSIAELAEKLPQQDGLVCHTAGAVSIDVLKRFKHRGVLYPLQSLRSGQETDEVPLLIETNDQGSGDALDALLKTCGFTYETSSSEKRLYYHLAAVFANNFSNAMLAVSEKISRQNGLNHEMLQPLIRKTLENAMRYSAELSQTGPAIRNDHSTMKKHQELLEKDTQLLSIYQTVSEFIRSQSPEKDF